ncbi:MAG: hypothetical protein JXA42_24515 [Anaerolineales bacterium]|nr:hypothetical protein [Anaerolineales bacterium]
MHKTLREYTRLIVQGDPYFMGWQHGCQVREMRPSIVEAITSRLEQFDQDSANSGSETIYRETVQLLQERDPAFLEMIRGQSEALELGSDMLLRYNLVGFLDDCIKNCPVEGCTTWAATGTAAVDGRPLLVKNRDCLPELLSLQVVIHATPKTGYRYISVGTAGSTGVQSSGMNQVGLTVADTYVRSTDQGPGLPDSSLMMHILESQDSVASAVDYLRSVPHLGRNNLILADAQGYLAVFEIGHRKQGLYECRDGFLVNTNHFISSELKNCFVDDSNPRKRGNSKYRYRKITSELNSAWGQIDVPFAQKLMMIHGDQVPSICRHPMEAADSATISTAIFLPAQLEMHFAHGAPCMGTYAVEEFTF